VAEQRILATLDASQRSALDASIAESEVVATLVSRDLHDVVASLSRFDPSGEHLKVVDEEFRVKGTASLARAFREAAAFDGDVDSRAVLARIKDRVRFSIQVPEDGYSATVAAALAALRERGYQVSELVSFWGTGGRHNGLNVTLHDRNQFTIELQFPTPLSRTIGKQTHALYEISRLKGGQAVERVAAFLRILEINKANGITDHQPAGLERLGEMRKVNTSLTRWIAKEPLVWEGYRRWLERNGMTFEQALEHHGLTPQDVLDGDRSDAASERLGLQLPGRAEE